MKTSHVHTPPTYTGRCAECGERIESPSQALREYAIRNDMTLVTFHTTIKITAKALAACGMNQR